MCYLVDAVLVTFTPDLELLRSSLVSLAKQVRTVYLIDNSEDIDSVVGVAVASKKLKNVKLISLNENTGIGRAQNIGIKRCIDASAEFIVLSDQDTIYPADYVRKMIVNFELIGDVANVIAIAPNFINMNKNGGPEGFFELDGFRSVNVGYGCFYQEISQAIASGMMIACQMISKAGMMDERLFIDWVDFEWCWRVRSKGYKIFGFNNVAIEHGLGDAVVELRGKKYSLHAPIRNYYIIRNGLNIALKRNYLPLSMRLGIFIKSLRYCLVFAWLSRRETGNFLYCITGLLHGLTGRTGKF